VKGKKKYIDVNVPKQWEPYLQEALEKLEIQKQLEINDFTQTYSGLGSWIIREFLLDKTSFRFEHINTKEDHITILDKRIRRVVDVYPREENVLWCGYCSRSDCEHAAFAVTIPEVRKVLEKKGWHIP
jgi:hypothetical protein